MSFLTLPRGIRWPFRIRATAAVLCVLAVQMAVAAPPVDSQSSPGADWQQRLRSQIAALDAGSQAKLGVYVRDLDTGNFVSHQAEQRWYIASMVKLPVAIAVMRGVDAGHFTLDTQVTLRASDYVDGAGPTSSQPVGTPLRVRYLIEQMMVLSDNTATDMLIDLVGIGEVNTVLQSLVPEGFWRITSLGDVRRLIYGQVVPGAEQLSGRELLMLRRLPSDSERLRWLAKRTETPAGRFRMPSLDAAYNAYYTSGLNSARLDAYADLLERLLKGEVLAASSTDYLLQVMGRAATGTHRVKAGLPPGSHFFHKTGTQRRRICDAGIVRAPEGSTPRRVIVVACARDDPSLESSEFALAQVGAALCRSGLLTHGVPDAPSCPVVLRPARGTADPER